MNKMLEKGRKGITPVIAIVLLLTVTIGAVGILYTQVGDLLEQDGGFEDIDRVQDTSLDLRSMYYNDDEGQVKMVVANDGDRGVDLSDEFFIEFNGVNYDVADDAGVLDDYAPDYNKEDLRGEEGCLADPDDNVPVQLNPGDQEECNIGLNDLPDTFDDELEITFQLDGSSRTWDYTCDVAEDDQDFC